eukprot:CFRG1283T1
MPLDLNTNQVVSRSSALPHSREELVRLHIQSLRSLGYLESADTLERESGFTLESDVVNAFRTCMLSGDWNVVIKFINDVLRENPERRDEALFLVYEQKYLELIISQNSAEALLCLQTELAPLVIPEQELLTCRLHVLSSLLMCEKAEAMKMKLNWEGEGEKSRMALLKSLQEYFPATLMIKENRLNVLIDQALEYQRSTCVYHNQNDICTLPSLLIDHNCTLESLPRVTKHVFKDHDDEVWYVKFSNNGKMLASASKDCTVRVWEVSTYKLMYTLEGHALPISFVGWCPDDKLILSCSNDKTLRLWDLEDGARCTLNITEHTQSVTSCAWSQKRDFFISAGLDQKICVWNTKGEKMRSWDGVRVNDLAVTNDGAYLVAICHEKKIRMYDMLTFAEEQIQESDSITSLCVSADSKHVLVNLSSQEIHLWHILEKRLVTKYYGQKQGKFVIRSCFGGFNDAFVVSGSEDYKIYLWNRKNALLLDVMSGHTGTVNSVCWSPTNPSVFASCSDDKTVRLWGVAETSSET